MLRGVDRTRKGCPVFLDIPVAPLKQQVGVSLYRWLVGWLVCSSLLSTVNTLLIAFNDGLMGILSPVMVNNVWLTMVGNGQQYSTMVLHNSYFVADIDPSKRNPPRRG